MATAICTVNEAMFVKGNNAQFIAKAKFVKGNNTLYLLPKHEHELPMLLKKQLFDYLNVQQQSVSLISI